VDEFVVTYLTSTRIRNPIDPQSASRQARADTVGNVGVLPGLVDFDAVEGFGEGGEGDGGGFG